ncbi:lysozyme [Paraburkholderia sp. JPY419]|uniref:lysozyme n=1 Tax=Paraburkholderia sp. JPY419 TaxID=667660 RepID=UPI003D240C48
MTHPLHECVTNANANSNVNVYVTRYCKPWKLSAGGIEFLKGWEKFSAVIYDKDGSGKGNATIGYGHLVHMGPISGAISEKHFSNGIAEADADNMLRADVEKAERIVNNSIKVPLHQYEYDALVCFIYNLQGHGANLLDFVNTGDYDKVGDKMRTYSHDHQGRLVKGLLRRRHREAEMFEAGIYDSSH